MKIETIYQAKDRGTVLGCVPTIHPRIGGIVRSPSTGQAWLISGVEKFCVEWRPGMRCGLLLQSREDGAMPAEGDDVEMIEPLDLLARLDEAEHNVRTLRAECARLGAAACDAKWDLMP